MFSKSWKRSVKPSGLSWMEDMTTSSASWHPVWDWRNQSWRTPYWKEIRQLGFILCFFFCESHFISLQTDLLWENYCHHFFTEPNLSNLILLWDIRWRFLRWKLCHTFWQIDRMEQFFAADGLPHLMFFYQEPEPVEAGNGKVLGKR